MKGKFEKPFKELLVEMYFSFQLIIGLLPPEGIRRGASRKLKENHETFKTINNAKISSIVYFFKSFIHFFKFPLSLLLFLSFLVVVGQFIEN